jgi:hypothetical protein
MGVLEISDIAEKLEEHLAKKLDKGSDYDEIIEFSSIEVPLLQLLISQMMNQSCSNFYKASKHLLRKLEELDTAQPSSIETTHEKHRTDMNIFSLTTQESRSRP